MVIEIQAATVLQMTILPSLNEQKRNSIELTTRFVLAANLSFPHLTIFMKSYLITKLSLPAQRGYSEIRRSNRDRH